MAALTGQALINATVEMRRKLLETCRVTPTPGVDGVPGVPNANPADLAYEVHPENDFTPTAPGAANPQAPNPSLDPNVELPINGTDTRTWLRFGAFFEAYGVIDDQWQGYPTFNVFPQFAGTYDFTPTPGKGSYIVPLIGEKLVRGQVVGCHVPLFYKEYLNLNPFEHSMNIDCKAFVQTESVIFTILKGLFADASKFAAGLSAVAAAQAIAPAGVAAVEQAINQLLKDKVTEVGSEHPVVNVTPQKWMRSINQTTWTCYKYLRFDRIYPQIAPIVGSDDWDRFLALFRLVLTTGTDIETFATIAPPAGQ